VIPDTAKIEIDFQSEDDAVFLTLDGQIGIELARGGSHPGGFVEGKGKLHLVRPPRASSMPICPSRVRKTASSSD